MSINDPQGLRTQLLISVAMCTYNGARFLQEQLDSIAAQTLLPDELVICDDGSTDATGEIARSFAASAPFSVLFYKNEDKLGSTKNFERAIGLCKGELIALSDQDDVWYPEKLDKLSATLNLDPTIGGLFSDAVLVDQDTRPTGQRLWATMGFFPKRRRGKLVLDLKQVLLKQYVVTGATLMFRSSLRSSSLPLSAAWVHDGWIAWMITLYSRLEAVEEPLLKYRIHGTQQLGIGPQTLRSRLARTRRKGLDQYLRLAAEFEAVRDRWTAIPGPDWHVRMKDLQGKIEHSYMRVKLPKNRLLRAFRILLSWRAYQIYTRGWSTMAKDLLP